MTGRNICAGLWATQLAKKPYNYADNQGNNNNYYPKAKFKYVSYQIASTHAHGQENKQERQQGIKLHRKKNSGEKISNSYRPILMC